MWLWLVPLSPWRHQRYSQREARVPHPSYHHQAQQDATQAQQEWLVIRAGQGYKDAITVENDQRSLEATNT